jgi:hypothetical protein
MHQIGWLVCFGSISQTRKTSIFAANEDASEEIGFLFLKRGIDY